MTDSERSGAWNRHGVDPTGSATAHRRTPTAPNDAGFVEAPDAAAQASYARYSKRGLSTVLMAGATVVVALAVFAGALFYTGTLDALMNGEMNLESLLGGSVTRQVAPRAPTAGSTSSVDPTSAIRIPERAARRLFYEQIASQHSILGLVDNRFERFDFGKVTKKNDIAEVRIVGRYRDGVSMRGTLTLRQYKGVWFFETIMADANAPNRDYTTPAYDPTVVDVILKAQAERQDAIEEILDGTHTSFVVDRVENGAGTVTVVGKQLGDKVRTEFLVLRKVIDGDVYWFLVGVQQR